MCFGCCLFIGHYISIDGPEIDSNRNHFRALSYHAPADHESPRSPACSLTCQNAVCNYVPKCAQVYA